MMSTDQEINESYPVAGYNYAEEGPMPSTDQMINESVAKKLGWTIYPDIVDPLHRYWFYPNTKKSVKDDDLPDYCQSIEAAWEILEKIKEKFDGVFLYNYTGKWVVADPYGAGNELVGATLAEADTAPMAICLAFLKLPVLNVSVKA